MDKSRKVSIIGRIIVITASILAIIKVAATWLELNKVPIFLSDLVKDEYTLFEITDFIDSINRFVDNENVSIFSTFLYFGAIVTIALCGVNILMAVINSNKVKYVSGACFTMSFLLVAVYLGAIFYINYEVKEATYSLVKDVLQSTINPYLLLAFCGLANIGANIKKREFILPPQEKFCTKCGAKVNSANKFCIHCGNRL